MKRILMLIPIIFMVKCSSIVLSIVSPKVAVSESVVFNNKLPAGSYVAYQISDKENQFGKLNLYAELIDKNETGSILKIKSYYDSRSMSLFMGMHGLSDISIEYHLDNNYKTKAAYVLDSNGKHYETKNIDYVQFTPKIIFEDSGYEIITHAGKFQCDLKITDTDSRYDVKFYDKDTLLFGIRMLTLNKKQVDKFISLDKVEKTNYKSDTFMELYKIGFKP
jgi:hypothetical protein